MPLIKGTSDKSFKKNLEIEMEHGKSRNQSLAIAYAMRRKAKKTMSEGGDVDQMIMEDNIVDRIMKSRSGAEANDTGTGQEADKLPNQFDDLVLRDDLESSNSGAADGDYLDNEQEDKDRKDIVSRIIRSMAKKDRLPKPL